ncbi:MAG: signal peptidase II [Clostridia bacterium]|nr:signal peptidase II [Clostridia bacterium]
MNKIKFFVLMTSLIVIDQISKVLIAINKEVLPKTIINGLLNITYCENRGIAFGFASGHVHFFSILTLMLLLIITVLVYLKFDKMNGLYSSGAAMLISGGIGNFIDRAFRSYVVDFIDIRLFEFPIFNIADICIVLGVVILGIASVINYRREEVEGNNS